MVAHSCKPGNQRLSRKIIRLRPAKTIQWDLISDNLGQWDGLWVTSTDELAQPPGFHPWNPNRGRRKAASQRPPAATYASPLPNKKTERNFKIVKLLESWASLPAFESARLCHHTLWNAFHSHTVCLSFSSSVKQWRVIELKRLFQR